MKFFRETEVFTGRRKGEVRRWAMAVRRTLASELTSAGVASTQGVGFEDCVAGIEETDSRTFMAATCCPAPRSLQEGLPAVSCP